jgi:chemotaxis protein CheC
MQNYMNIGEIQKDILQELGNIGAGNAATALSNLLNDRIEITVPKLKFIDINEISEILGGPENEVVGIVVKMTEDVDGLLIYIMNFDFVKHLLGTLVNEEVDFFRGITDIGMSALKEVSNILSGSYVNALSSLTNLDIRLSLPEIAIDMVGAILNFPASLIGEMGDQLLLIEEDFIISQNLIQSHLLIIPDLHSLNEIMKRLGVE